MERIQEAIEKARKEREGKVGQEPVERSADIDASIEQQASGLDFGKAISVEYTKTKKIVISDEELKAKRVIAGFAHDPRSDVYRQLRSQVLKKMRDNKWNTLAITSPSKKSGKSLTAINLAISLSQEVNQTVMLVDLDLRNPAIHEILGFEANKGIVDYVRKEASLDEVLINPGFERLVILPGTPQGPFSSEILSSPDMKQLKQELATRYESRIIIFDLPCLLGSDDALVFTPTVDATLLVVEDGASSREELERSLKLLEGSELLGTVLNKQT